VKEHTPPPDLAALPKAEVHIHLEGSVRPATLEEFAAREGVSISRVFSDLPSFVDAYGEAAALMVRPGDYKRLVREYCEDALRAGVRYAELEVAPALRPGAQHRLAEAAEEAGKQTDVTVRLVLGLGRIMPIEIAIPALDIISELPGYTVLGLGGPEEGYPAAPFQEAFAEARRRGLRLAPHAGEAAGADSVREVIDLLGAERIQHGVRCVEDPALLAEIVERRIPLAVCPTSNVQLGVVKDIRAHQLRQLWDAGAIVSVNTDDPGFFDCDLLTEYAIAGQLLGLDREGYARLARYSIESTFAPDDLKSQLGSEIEDWAKRG
jgi:adenosine deaminase